MSKHTPGPWNLQGYCEDGFPAIYREVFNEKGDITKATQVLPFYDCDPQSETYARHMADKRLIEAAPDLLAACEAFIALFQDSDMRPEDECHELYSQMDAALTKAKGEEL